MWQRTYKCAAVVAAALGCIPMAAAPTSHAETASIGDADTVDRDYSGDLPRLPPTEADKALATFEIEPGFRLELAAAEPQVADPVAMEFDEHGRLFVVEMLGYSEDANDRLGRIRLLEDADRDGKFEKSTVFAEGLAWPTAVICYDDGIFVGAAPDILYYKDADDDGRADERRVVFTGFGVDNVQGLLNSFRWGIDNRIHVAVSRCGADLRRAYQPAAESLVLRGRNFAFDPRSLEFEATSGASQHGFCFDDCGGAFTCSNSDHIQQILIEDRYLSRNPLVSPPPVLRSVALEGPAAEVFRISPVEPWREIRTRLRVKGLVPGPIEGGGRAAGYFTSATGVTVYTGDAWPAEYYGNAFIGDVGSNLVHRKIIEQQPNSVPLVARRASEGREFLASRDTWFRPVQFAHGPDGNLYVLDMYREVIEHPASLPPVLKKHLDLTSGRDRGRIYRIVSTAEKDKRRRERATRTLPGEARTNELVAMLAHPNGWHRTTAARLLYERNDPAAMGELKELLHSNARPEGRLLALYLVTTLKDLDVDTLLLALADSHPRLREHAARLAGKWLWSVRVRPASEWRGVEQAVMSLAGDPDLGVRYQVAFALGEIVNPKRVDALSSIIRRDLGNEYVVAAVFSSLARDAEKLLHKLLADRSFVESTDGQAFLLELARQIGASGDRRELASLVADLANVRKDDGPLAGKLLVSALAGAGAKRQAVRQELASSAGGVTEEIIAALLAEAFELATNDQGDPSRRAAAVAALPLGDFEMAAPVLTELLAPRQPQEVQRAAIAALAQFGDADVAAPVIDAWPGMSPTLRLPAAELMLSRTRSTKALLAAVEESRLSPRDLDPSTIQRLKTHSDASVREQAGRLFKGAAGQRIDVVDSYQEALELSGDAVRGGEVFQKNCATCHRKGGVGTEVGADLATVVSRTPEALLISILDPNREVDPKYVQYTVLTVDGLVASGMIAAETATSVTLTGAEKATKTIPRADIEELRSTGLTLMPEGFEKVIDKQAMADLVAFLRSE